MERFASICVFCGSNGGKGPKFYKVATELGYELAKRKIRLVYGGGSLGLMEGVSSSAYFGGSKVLGIIPKTLNKFEIVGITLGDELQVSSIKDRLANMLANSDAFIILPGGFGTLAELFQVISWAQLNIHNKPIGILNVDGFFDGLLSFIDHAVAQEFISPLARQILVTASTVAELIDQLQVYEPKLDPEMAVLDWSSNKRRFKSKLDFTLSI